jgi:predicted nucleic acid-binding protein
MANKVISNTGPFIHLSEIKFLNALGIFSEIFISREVHKELIKSNIKIPKKVKILELNSQSKDFTKILINQYELDLGESSSIALAIQEKINFFITDDLDARIIAKSYNIEIHGTIGIILRAFRKKIIDKKTAIEKIKSLKEKSSLYITTDLINEIIRAINKFNN